VNQVLHALVAQPEEGGGGGQGPQQQPQGCQQMSGMLIPILIMFAIIYFLMIRPQQKQQKKHKAMISALKKGDKVITNAGIFGTVTGMTEGVLTLEVAKNVHIRVLRGQVAGFQPDSLGKESEAQPVVPDEKK
jgi:preprotein translocase subunit YajC